MGHAVFQVFPDAFVEKELGLLLVYCSEKRSGCSWKGHRNVLEVTLPFALLSSR